MKQQLTTPKISVIIPTLNRAESLQTAILSIQNQTFPKEDFEIIVVDNGSRDQSRSIVQNLILNCSTLIRYLYEPEPGLHNARHAGAAKSRGEILLYCDDDVIASDQWIEQIYLGFVQNPKCAVVGGKIKAHWGSDPPDWLFQFGTRTNIGLLSLLDFGEGCSQLPERQYVYGANMAVRKSALYEVGGFNPDGMPEDQLMYRGDGEIGLQKKIRKSGYDIVYNGSAVVEHVVNPARLTPEYAYQRYYREGFSRAYSRYREHNGARFPIMAGTFISFLRLCLYRFIRMVNTDRCSKIKLKSLELLMASDIKQIFRINRINDLKQFVIAKRYI